MFFEFFDLLLKLENFLFCSGEFCPKGLQLGFLFGHLIFDLGVGVCGCCVQEEGRVYNTFNFILSASLCAVHLSKAS